MPLMFWVKIVDVVVLSGLVYFAWTLQRRMMLTGDRSLAGRLMVIGPITTVLGFAAILFAVLAFH